MVNIKRIIFFIGLLYFNCTLSSQPKIEIGNRKDKNQNFNILEAKTDIQVLIRQVLIWSDTCRAFDLYPAISDEHDSMYIGFDMNIVNKNMTILSQTGFFSLSFIENYNRIIKTLDKKIRNKKIDWMVGDLPTFNFNMSYIDVNPWCLCQGFLIEQFDGIEIINLNSSVGELKFKWTKDSEWINFKFNVVNEDTKWKISYMEGFDFE